MHLLNYTNPNVHHGWMQSTFPLGPQTIMMTLPAGVVAKSVELLKAGHSVALEQKRQMLHFTVPRVEDYEVAAITVT